MFGRLRSRGAASPRTPSSSLLLRCALIMLMWSVSSIRAQQPANDEAIPEITVVITAERIEEAEAQAPRQVFIVPRERIVEGGAESARDVLKFVPGLVVRQYGGRGAVTSVSLRGHSSGQVLVLLDGRRLNTAQAGAVDLCDIPATNIERIEVMYGGASTLYGADAVGGVINIITRAPGDEPSADATVEVGSYGFNREVASVAGRSGDWRVVLDLDRTFAANDYTFIGRTGAIERRANASYRGLRGSLRVDRTFDSGAELRVSYQAAQLHKRVPGSIEFPSPNAWQTDDQQFFLASYSDLTGDGEWQALLHHDEIRIHYVDPDAVVPVDNRISNVKDALELVATNYSDSERFRLTWGGEVRSDRGSSGSTQGLHADRTVAAFAEGKWTRGGNIYVGGVRFENHSTFGSQLSPHVGYSHDFDRGRLLRLNYTRSFRAPTFNDLYWQEDAFSVGNPALRPEFAHTFDLSFDRPVEGGTFRTALFLSDVRDGIVWAPNAVGKWQPTNVGRSQLSGIEVGWHGVQFGEFEVSAHLTYQNPRNLSQDPNQRGRLLPYQPQALGLVDVGYCEQDWRASLVMRAEGKRYSNFANTAAIPGFAVFDLNVGAILHSDWRLGLTVSNLFERRYEVQENYPMPGREIKFSLSRTF